MIEQDERGGYDTFDSAVVCAETEEEAKAIHPARVVHQGTQDDWADDGCWASSPNRVRATEIGTAKTGLEKGVVVASFDAG